MENCAVELEDVIPLADLEELIESERTVIAKMVEIKRTVLKVHKDCSIAQTVGSATSITGAAATIGGLLLGPFTAGFSIGLTAYGLTASIGGTATSVGTSIASATQTKKWADELKKVLESRQATHRKIGHQILSSSVWEDVIKVTCGSFSAAVGIGCKISTLVKLQKYVSLFGAEFVDELAAFYITSKASTIGPKYLEYLDKLVVTVKPSASPFLALKLFKSLSVVAGLASIGCDVYSIVDTWTKDPKLCRQIDEIIDGLKMCVEELEEFKEEYEYNDTQQQSCNVTLN